MHLFGCKCILNKSDDKSLQIVSLRGEFESKQNAMQIAYWI